jgi:hypothetical protein
MLPHRYDHVTRACEPCTARKAPSMHILACMPFITKASYANPRLKKFIISKHVKLEQKTIPMNKIGQTSIYYLTTKDQKSRVHVENSLLLN